MTIGHQANQPDCCHFIALHVICILVCQMKEWLESFKKSCWVTLCELCASAPKPDRMKLSEFWEEFVETVSPYFHRYVYDAASALAISAKYTMWTHSPAELPTERLPHTSYSTTQRASPPPNAASLILLASHPTVFQFAGLQPAS